GGLFNPVVRELLHVAPLHGRLSGQPAAGGLHRPDLHRGRHRQRPGAGAPAVLGKGFPQSALYVALNAAGPVDGTRPRNWATVWPTRPSACPGSTKAGPLTRPKRWPCSSNSTGAGITRSNRPSRAGSFSLWEASFHGTGGTPRSRQAVRPNGSRRGGQPDHRGWRI